MQPIDSKYQLYTQTLGFNHAAMNPIAFYNDTTSGPRNPVKAGWVFFTIVVVNEIRGLMVAYEGAKVMGWL